jgi:hypothetical protein
MEAQPQNPDRNLAMDLARATEAAALAAGRWFGRGDKNGADGAAVDAMRLVLNTVPMEGVVVIGEGEKDEAPMLFNGEQIGDGSPPVVDIAVDPLEGTTLCARGMPSALAVIALAERGSMFDPGPCVYMEKIAGGEPSPICSPWKSIGASSFSPSPITTTPSIATESRTKRIASTAAPSAASLSPRPTQRAAARAAASVTRTSSSARLRSGLVAGVPSIPRNPIQTIRVSAWTAGA